VPFAGDGLIYLVEVLLFLTPFGIYVLWRRSQSSRAPASRLLLVAVASVGLGLAGAVWYGFSRSSDRGSVYVPARLGPDGRVISGQTEPAR